MNTKVYEGESYAYVGDKWADQDPIWCDVLEVRHNPDRRCAQAKVQLDVRMEQNGGAFPRKMRPVWVYVDELESLEKHPLLT